jgi:GNAT superfamily N-acetyltransferase
MIVETASAADRPGFLSLAADLEPRLGHLADAPELSAALTTHLDAETAVCARHPDTPTLLLGGLLLAGQYPVYRITWLAVRPGERQHGIGRALVAHALEHLARRPCRVEVSVVSDDHPGADTGGRVFLEHLGFHPGEPAPPAPDGTGRQWYRRTVHSGRHVEPLLVPARDTQHSG